MSRWGMFCAFASAIPMQYAEEESDKTMKEPDTRTANVFSLRRKIYIVELLNKNAFFRNYYNVFIFLGVRGPRRSSSHLSAHTVTLQ
jgi:hypothetical protein